MTRAGAEREKLQAALAPLIQFGGWADTAAALRHMLGDFPDSLEAKGRLGALLILDSGSAGEAASLIGEALAGGAALALAVGDTFAATGRFDEAQGFYRRAAAQAADDPAPQRRLVMAMLSARPLAKAQGELALLGADDLLLLAQGLMFAEDRPADCAVILERLLALAPSSVSGLRLLAQCRNLEGRPAEALALALKAKALTRAGRTPEPSADTDIAAFAMGAGRLDLAWDYLESRLAPGWKRVMTPERDFPMPMWRGEPPAGKAILVWREDGLGDEIVYSSCLPDLVATGALVTYECHPRLLSIFDRSFPDATVRPAPLVEGEVRDYAGFDYHLPLQSLMKHFRRRLTDFPRRPHFTPLPERSALWRARIAALGPGQTIGIAWKSGNHNALRDRYYAPLADWEPVLRLQGCRFVNLQYGQCDEELDQAEQAFGIRIHRWDDLDLRGDFEGQLALIANLDLVVTAPITPIHLAGAVGAHGLLASTLPSPKALGQDHYPWYAGIDCLYRSALEPKRAVFERVAARIDARIGGGP